MLVTLCASVYCIVVCWLYCWKKFQCSKLCITLFLLSDRLFYFWCVVCFDSLYFDSCHCIRVL